jgi:hypothetical protein
MPHIALAQNTSGDVVTAGTTQPALDPNQIYNTGNIVQPTVTGTGTTPWINGVYQDQLTCWAPGQPGNCGPNPSVRPGGYINFSYGTTDLYQVQAISSVLPNSGTGLRVNGYNFSFTAKNGNGWDDARVDYLNAYVNFSGTDGKSVRYDYYDLNYKFDWTYFNYDKTFDTPFASKDLSTVRYGFVGRDNNFWAGAYGPEVMNVSFSLKYSVDPCATNVLSSPSCPGYLDALAKIITIETIAPAPTTTTVVSEPTPTTTTTVTATVTEIVVPTQTQTTQPTQTVATTSPANSSSVVAVQPVVAPVVANPVASTQSSSSDKTQSGPTLSNILSTIRNNEKKEQAIVQNAVDNANAVAQSAVAQAEQTALSVASASNSNSITIANESVQTSTTNRSSSQSSVAMSSGPSNTTLSSTQATSSMQQLTSQNASTISITNNTQNQAVVSTNIANMLLMPQSALQQVQQSSNSTGTLLPVNNNQSPATNTTVTPTLAIETPVNTNAQTTTATNSQPVVVEGVVALLKPNTSEAKLEGERNTIPLSVLTNRADPMFEYFERNTQFQSNNSLEARPSNVNKNAENNEVAGVVTVERMNVVPVGYSVYTSLFLQDVAFYAPKEIYRNQKVIDNQRAVRVLNFASELKHQEMVNQQYGEK